MNILLRKRVLIFFFLLCQVLPVHAHWIQTHLFMTECARKTMVSDGHGAYVGFLDGKQPSSKTTFMETLLAGARDADLRANGLYAMDLHCSDYTKWLAECPADKIIANNVADWPVGDHGYNPVNGKGFFPQKMADGTSITGSDTWNGLDVEAHSATPRQSLVDLLNILGVGTIDEQLAMLHGILLISNAKSMAVEFYGRALNEWQLGNYNDAIYNLGIVLHLVQDMTVPTHVHIG
ncbi:MAG: hypothetical protein DRH07_09880, partial [Deltaproteobacteria bacterium]